MEVTIHIPLTVIAGLVGAIFIFALDKPTAWLEAQLRRLIVRRPS